MTWPGGLKYVGEVKDGQQNGRGTEYYPNGQIRLGIYKNGAWAGSQ
jgi:antitoxin component YwqK of YwqJK toxin-antitoxin module